MKAERITKKTEKKAQKKIVRKDMLRKLIKYDRRAMLRLLGILYLFAVAFSALSGLFHRLLIRGSEEVQAADAVFIAAAILYILSFIACIGVAFFGSVAHYFRDLLSPDGYLTLSIPASPEEHILSKTIAGAEMNFCTLFVCAFSLLLGGVVSGDVSFFQIGDFFRGLGSMIAAEPAGALLFLTEGVFLFVFVVLLAGCPFYAWGCIGRVQKKNFFLIAAGGLHLLLTVLLQSVFWDFFVANFVGWIDGIFYGIFSADARTHVLNWCCIAVAAGMHAVGFLIQRYVLYNKLDLV